MKGVIRPARPMAHSPRYEAHLAPAWRNLLASVDALYAELKAAPPAARLKALR